MDRDHDAIMHRSFAREEADTESFGSFFRESPLDEIGMRVTDVLKRERKWFVRFTLPCFIGFGNRLWLRFLARENFRVRFLANRYLTAAGRRNQEPGLQFDRRVTNGTLLHRGDEVEDVAADTTTRFDARLRLACPGTAHSLIECGGETLFALL